MSAHVETMMYAGATPWHGFGTYVGDEDILSDEAIIRAGLDWEVGLKPLFSHTDDHGVIDINSHEAIIRLSDGKPLGIASPNYHPVQNRESFNFLDALVEDGEVRYHTAGALFGGAKVWLLAKAHESEIIPGDKVDHYLLLYTGHDGKTKFRCFFTNVRVVCANTARIALREGIRSGIGIRHTKNVMHRIEDAREALGMARHSFDTNAKFFRELAGTPFSMKQWVELCERTFPTEDDSGKVAVTRAENNRRVLTNLYMDGRGTEIPGVRGTAWGAYNARTEYSSYQFPTRGSNGDERRFASLVDGPSANFVRNGTRALLEIAA